MSGCPWVSGLGDACAYADGHEGPHGYPIPEPDFAAGCAGGYGNCPTSEKGRGPCRCAEEAHRLYDERDAALAAAEALEARYRAGIRAALTALHAAHMALPDGESCPREFVDALTVSVEAHLLAALKGGAR